MGSTSEGTGSVKKGEHTPGPWTVSKSGVAVDQPGGTQVRFVTLKGASGVSFNSIADAALVAAAPDLLAACEAFVASCGSAAIACEACAPFKAAIKKARGEK